MYQYLLSQHLRRHLYRQAKRQEAYKKMIAGKSVKEVKFLSDSAKLKHEGNPEDKAHHHLCTKSTRHAREVDDRTGIRKERKHVSDAPCRSSSRAFEKESKNKKMQTEKDPGPGITLDKRQRSEKGILKRSEEDRNRTSASHQCKREQCIMEDDSKSARGNSSRLIAAKLREIEWGKRR